uniref:3'(2'),5'-bisphosphate nucleotidase n=1 Tax=Helicotheca tamesis TaxID=374047 RepID=A0A7S2GU34_9STRA|mmetsp:Transcript_11384/g.15770  ORF Transcript_11384/g.15770 Transcript_11384/m.15770 type:complete len:577 (+) Transcript_11384:108-1838(+)|eukprot:CAMPEP_0185725454 /NCGR_PEP_ID=MMETSP1171-20130828/1716_1 /TAXON_ID=374046 /ORGANISM="Helicotheca tamensis, Strain CCMP826" /LENGTH=576 /DNA_ID=CAMNT_0028393593 /DNA_START=69 /DNA_END=1799 /DNA_ORIENTATION=+
MIPFTILLLLFSSPQESWCHNNNSPKNRHDKKSGIVGITANTKSTTDDNNPFAAFVVANQTNAGKEQADAASTSSSSSILSSSSTTLSSSTYSAKRLSLSSPLFATRRHLSRPQNQSQALQNRHTFVPPPLSPSSSSSSLYHSTKSSDTEKDNDETNELPSNFPRRTDALAAITAVRKACAITRQIQPLRGPSSSSSSPKHDKIATVTKADLSPVTVGDYASQAVILHHLHFMFPYDSFIAEESSEVLKQDELLADTILKAIQNAAGEEGKEGAQIGSVEELMESIDLGQTYNSDGSTKKNQHEEDGRTTTRRVWCLDPIDGTKGFLRGKLDGGQYAVALALLEDGKPTIGILGCPNLPVSTNDDQYEWADDETNENNMQSRGCIFVASKGGGCYQLPLFPKEEDESMDEEEEMKRNKVRVTPNDGSVRGVEDARFCVGVEKSIADALGQANAIATTLHGPNAIDPTTDSIIQSTKMDSQAKYAVLARSGAEIYLRLPKPGYVEWIWDHAAGSVVITEAGGTMTDVDGKEIDFSFGAKLSPNVRGIVGTNGGVVHEAVLEAYQKLSKEERGGGEKK